MSNALKLVLLQNAFDAALRTFGQSQEDIQKLLDTGVLTKNDSGQFTIEFRNRVMLPIRDKRGRVIAFGGRVLPNDEQGAEI